MTESPANWYPDPLGRYELRYWDGAVWTDYVATQGVQALDPLAAAQAEQAAQAAQAYAARGRGGGTVLTEPVLVVSQRPEATETAHEFAIADQFGRHVGWVIEVGQGSAKKALRRLSSVDQFLARTLQITDPSGEVLLQITRPGKVFKSRVIVQDGDGHEIGQILQQNVWGKIRISLESGGHQYGAIDAENWRAWDFTVQDDTSTEVARITKTWEGLSTARFATDDSYVVRIYRPLEDPLRSLVVAAALAIDTALKQDDSRN